MSFHEEKAAREPGAWKKPLRGEWNKKIKGKVHMFSGDQQQSDGNGLT